MVVVYQWDDEPNLYLEKMQPEITKSFHPLNKNWLWMEFPGAATLSPFHHHNFFWLPRFIDQSAVGQ